MQGSARESRLETDSDRCPPPEGVRIGHRDDEGAAGNSPSLATFQRSYSHCTAVARVPRHSGAAIHTDRERELPIVAPLPARPGRVKDSNVRADAPPKDSRSQASHHRRRRSQSVREMRIDDFEDV